MQELILQAGFCAHNHIIILEQDERTCIFGVLEENLVLERKLRKAWPHLNLQFRIIEQDVFQVRLARLFSQTREYGTEDTERAYPGRNSETESSKNTDTVQDSPEASIDTIEDEAPIINLLNSIFLDAISKNASDIHIETGKTGTTVRFRLDGLLVPMQTVPAPVGRALAARLKVLAHLNVLEQRRPQDGRIELRTAHLTLDVRISIVPAALGESIVLRILPDTMFPLSLQELGFSADQIRMIEPFLRFPSGLILITGPTGSGKTTSLAAFLHILNKPDVKIISIEDPVEYRIDGVTQIQTNDELGLSFDVLLKRIFRQDPDIIMIGEIRDAKTAELAVRAALTGHLVFSTLHTDNAVESVMRLEDLNVPPYLISAVLRGVISQRLIRRVCTKCGGTGCSVCAHTGAKGRIAAAEIFPIDDTFAEAVYTRASPQELYRQRKQKGLPSIYEDALEKMQQGIITQQEIARVLGSPPPGEV